MREMGFGPHPLTNNRDTKLNPNNKNLLQLKLNSRNDKKPLSSGNDWAYKALQLEYPNILPVFHSVGLTSPLICLSGSGQLFHQEFRKDINLVFISVTFFPEVDLCHHLVGETV